MANFSALKTIIQQWIKTNANNEITGALLQEILLSIVVTLGDDAINDLAADITAEVTARQNADGTLQQNINAEALSRAQADTLIQQGLAAEIVDRVDGETALDGRIDTEALARSEADTLLQTNIDSEEAARIADDNALNTLIENEAAARILADNTLQAAINAINTAIQNGFLYMGIATPSSAPTTGKVFYIALKGGRYTNFGNVQVQEGINILRKPSTSWIVEHIYDDDLLRTTLASSIDEMMREINGFEREVQTLIEDYRPIVINGNVTNAPDEEDLTATPNDLLKFKDRVYNPLIFSGMGYKILRKNIRPTEESAVFDGFVEDVPTSGTLSGTPDAIFWDRINEVFVGKQNDDYYSAWTDDDDFVPTSQSIIYMNDSNPYRWNGTDFYIDDDVVPNLKNILTQDMLSEDNTRYEIRYDFDLNDATITIPANCILEFDGGSLSNGSLTGDVSIINQPDDFLASVNCAGLDILSMPHVSKDGIMDVVDNYLSNGDFSARCEQNLKYLNSYYPVAGLDKVYLFCKPNQYPATRLMWYDKDFYLISYSGWSQAHNGVDVPEGAAYVSAMISFDCRQIADIPELLGRIYGNFLDRAGIPILTDYIKDKRGVTKEYYNVDMTDLTRVYIEGASSSVNYKKYMQFAPTNENYKSICIPYSVLKYFDYLCVKPNEDYITRIHMLKKEPTVNGEIVEYSDYYGENRKLEKDTEAVYLPIMEDVKYIIVYCQWQDRVAKPEYIRLYTADKLGLQTSSTEPFINSSVRNPNKYSMHIMHWNIGNYSKGDTKTAIDDSNYTAKYNSFVGFLDKYKDYNKFINEYYPVFAVRESGNVNGYTVFHGEYTQKIFPRTNATDNLAYFAVDGLASHKLQQFKSWKGLQRTTGAYQTPKPYVIYRYFLGNASIYIVHTHLPSNMTADIWRNAADEMMNAVAGYSNVIILGDFNLTQRSDMQGFVDAGYSVANDLDLDGGNIKPTHTRYIDGENGREVYYDPDTHQPTVNCFDWCVYKGNFTVTDFHVCYDAVDSGSSDGDIEHMLSDHWPIALTINFENSSMVPAERGNMKFEPTNNIPLWFNGLEWFDNAQRINYKPLTDVLTFTPGFYGVNSGPSMSALTNADKLPKSLQDTPAGFAMMVFPFDRSSIGNRVACIIKPNNNGVMYVGYSNTGEPNPTSWDKWNRYYGVYETRTDYAKHKGTTSERPSNTYVYATKPWAAGFIYIDTTLNKPIWYKDTGWIEYDGCEAGIARSGDTRPAGNKIYVGFQFFDTTLGKPIWWDGTNWVDATGATV